MGILYRLIFASGKSYVGVTESDSMNRRLSQHKYMAKKGSSLPVHCAWRKYGDPDVEILGSFYGEELYMQEIIAITFMETALPNGYNVLAGGQASPAINDEVKRKISAAQKRRYEDPLERLAASERMKNISDEHRKRLSMSLTGKTLSESTKQKLREANLGNKHSEETRQKMSQAHKGKKYSEETIQRMREAARKRMQSPEAKQQLKAASIAGGQTMKSKAKKK